MRGRKWELFLAMAKKKTQYQSLIDNVDSFSSEDIDAMDLRPWMKDALRELQDRNRHGFRHVTKARHAMGEIVDKVFASSKEDKEKWEQEYQPSGIVYVPTVPFELTLKSERNISNTFFVIPLDPLFLDDKAIWHYGHVCGTIPHPIAQSIIHQCNCVGPMSYREYRHFCREVENARQ